MLRALKSKNRGRKDTQQRLLVESLEARRLLAGNVAADVVDGNLVLRGDAESNRIELRPSADGVSAIVVVGVPGEDGDVTTINGALAFRATGVTGNVDAAMRNGDDLIYIHDLDLPGNLNVRTGRGDDAVLIGGLPRGDVLPTPQPQAVDAALLAPGTPVDPVPVDPGEPVPIDPVPILPIPNVTINGNARISTGAGSDGVAMGSVDVAKNLSVSSGLHDDVVRLGVNQLPGPAADLAPTTAAISVVDTVPDFNLPVDVGGSLRLGLGAGADQAWLESVHVDHNLRANLGGGDDLMVYDWGSVAGRIAVAGGAGTDIVALAHVKANAIGIRTHGGVDAVGLFDVSTRRLDVHLGAGDDLLILSNTTANRARLNGGAGTGDKIDFQGRNHLPNLRLLNFEIIT